MGPPPGFGTERKSLTLNRNPDAAALAHAAAAAAADVDVAAAAGHDRKWLLQVDDAATSPLIPPNTPTFTLRSWQFAKR